MPLIMEPRWGGGYSYLLGWPLTSAKPSGEVGSAGSSCSRPRHSTRLHHQPRPDQKWCRVLWDLICSRCLFLRNADFAINKLQPVAVITHFGTDKRCGCPIYVQSRDVLSPPPVLVCYCLPGCRPSLTLSLPPLLFLIKHYDSNFAQ